MSRCQLLFAVLLFLALSNNTQGWLFKKRNPFRHRQKTGKSSSNIGEAANGFKMIALSDAMKQQFVDAHNLARSNVEPPAADMQMVEWDDEIAEISQKFVRKCEFKHSDVKERILPGYPYGLGENLFVGMSKYHIKPDYITKKWDEERAYYNYTDLSCLPGKMCGHYTQVVWSTTTKIGCAIAECPRIKYTSFSILDLISACHYGPPGNWRGSKPYKEGEPCTSCPADARFCMNDFCSAI